MFEGEEGSWQFLTFSLSWMESSDANKRATSSERKMLFILWAVRLLANTESSFSWLNLFSYITLTTISQLGCLKIKKDRFEKKKRGLS